MTLLRNILEQAVAPAQKIIGIKRTPASDVLMLAIGLQESRLTMRRQLVGSPPKPTGPAAGLWQFERGGGVRGVLTHDASKHKARGLCAARAVPAETGTVWDMLPHDDVLAAGFARLLLYTDPAPLPAPGEVDAAWNYYIRNWRPGKPHRQTWDALYAQALQEAT